MGNVNVYYGVCVDNADPHNAHRIRFYALNKLDSVRKSMADITNILVTEDNQNIYTPWEYSSDTKKNDPHLANTFMPKHLNMVPEIGQLVKLMEFEDTSKIEYIGPYTTDMTEPKQSYLSGLQRTIPNNYLEAGIVPDINKLPITGRNNEQVILGDNQIVNKLNYITENKTKKPNYPFTQLSQYQTTLNTATKEVTRTVTSDYLIDFVLQVNFAYQNKIADTDKNFICVVKVYDSSKITNAQGLKGLKKSDVTFTPKFQKRLVAPVITFTIKSQTYKKLVNEFTNLLTAFKNREIYKFPQDFTSENYTYSEELFQLEIVNDFGFLPNDGGGLPDKPNVVINDNFVVIKDDNQIEYSQTSSEALRTTYGINTSGTDFYTLANFVNNAQYQNFVSKVQVTSRTETVNEDVVTTVEQEDSFSVNHVDKILLYSTENDVPLTSLTSGIEGVTQDKLAELFKSSGTAEERFKLAHPMLRGDKMLQLVITLIDLLLNHGHEAGKNPADSLDQTSRTALNQLIQNLQKDLQDDKNSTLLNHYIRLN